MNQALIEELEVQLSNVTSIIGYKHIQLQFLEMPDPIHEEMQKVFYYNSQRLQMGLMLYKSAYNNPEFHLDINGSYKRLMNGYCEFLIWYSDLVYSIPPDNTNITVDEFNQYKRMLNDLLLIYQLMPDAR